MGLHCFQKHVLSTYFNREQRKERKISFTIAKQYGNMASTWQFLYTGHVGMGMVAKTRGET